MFTNVTPTDLSADKVVAKVASALHNGTNKGAVVTSDVEPNLFKVMGMSESEVYKVHVIDLGQWLYRWVESRLDSAFIDGGWIDCEKYPGFSNFDIRIEEGKLLFVPWDKESGEHVIEESETLISLKGIDTSDEQVLTTVQNPVVDQTFQYMMLSRLQMDNEYFLGHGNGSEKVLWAGNVADQISKMKELHDQLIFKPEWLTMEAITSYESKMKGVLANAAHHN